MAGREGHMLKVLSYISVKRLTPAPALIFYVSMDSTPDASRKRRGVARRSSRAVLPRLRESQALSFLDTTQKLPSLCALLPIWMDLSVLRQMTGRPIAPGRGIRAFMVVANSL